MRVNADFTPFADRMRAANLPDIVIRTFEYYYNQLAEGRTGLLAEADIVPVASLPDAERFDATLAEAGRAALPQTILLKLNGGLGTGMGLERAKSLLVAREGLTFLDIIARQALISGAPLVLMNSFNTRDDSLAVLARYPELGRFGIPLDFLQHKVPKVVQADLTPASWPADPDLEWCPPGHGDIYTALLTSGMLDALLARGYQYAFVSNADNLGAVLDPAILGYFVTRRLSFLMEVADRTEADRKGGHLARRRDGRFILRESAQCPAEDMAAFQDIGRHRYFNTNNLWLNLPALQALLRANGGILGLPMIRNKKPIDPRDPSSTPVYQLETAMGAAIELFEDAGAVRVPRTRFAPVKTTDDLLAVRSDAYVLTEGFQVIPNPARALPA
ncbi:MAG: UTP--glucose-1-phosphate uridylyltransferase, partial [Anaerolineae bacterium]|nr:UTP--glucose-1-phosphate uridylyltransferase [Anaerolineae bacterium]